ncbi:MAG: ComEA family DNA-binding protein [Gammaproteobacteria bacterium]
MDIFRKILLALLIVVPSLLYAGEAVNINTADKAALMLIKGVGEKRAEAIITWREQHGPFKSVDELASVSGIGPAIVEANRDNLTTGPKQ